jgi:hypothetical protein
MRNCILRASACGNFLFVCGARVPFSHSKKINSPHAHKSAFPQEAGASNDVNGDGHAEDHDGLRRCFTQPTKLPMHAVQMKKEERPCLAVL